MRPLISMDVDPTGLQGDLLNMADILVTGGLLGGGSDGIHKLVSVITDFLDKTRQNINAPPPVS